MSTFLELYETLLGFVNFKLYTDLNLVYPPKIDEQRDAGGAGLAAYIIETTDGKDVVSDLARQEGEQAPTVRADKAQRKQTQKRLASLADKLAEIEGEEVDGEPEANQEMDEDLPQAAVPATTEEESVPTIDAWRAQESELSGFQNLFKGCVFWLSREVPRYSLEFVIRALGGEVGWDASAGAGSPFAEDDPRITHHIVDRPLQTTTSTNEDGTPVATAPKRYERREYLQPQWVYDSINAKKLVRTTGYHVGETLPPHLSPFVRLGEGDYIPEEAKTVDGDEGTKKAVDAMEVDDAAANDEEEAEEIEEEEEDEEEEDVEEEDVEEEASEDEEALHQAELEAEAAGLSFSEYLQKKATQDKPNKKADKPAKKQTAAEAEAQERKELAIMMMSKKDKHLYNKIRFGKQRKEEAVSDCMLGSIQEHYIYES